MSRVYQLIAGITDVPTQRALRALSDDIPGAPKVRSITGNTTQEQVDSLVAALVALGLAKDDR